MNEMPAAEQLTPTQYIQHHLTNLTHALGPGSFWTLNVDTAVMSVALGIAGLGFMFWVARGATSGVPNRRQAFVELAFNFVDDQVKGIFHGERHVFLAPLALTVFVWVLLLNAMDLLPIDISGLFYEHILRVPHWRQVATADVNTTFAMSLSVLSLMIFFSVKVKGLGGWLHELFCSPFGSNPLLWAGNLLFNLVEYVSKPLSLSLRLYGNMYAGEIIFLLLGLWAATGLVGSVFGALLGVGWAIFEVLIAVLQAYIFMMLTVVYVAMAYETH